MQFILTACCIVLFAQAALAAPAATQATQATSLWPAVGNVQKPWTRWWWPGNAVDKENLSRQIEQMAAAGFGGVEITPIYGVRGAESREVEFLSPAYMDLLQHAAAETKRHGMQLDMATGTGWPFGGPWVAPQDADARLPRQAGAIAAQPTGMKVKRAAPGCAGLVLNPFSTDAMQRYLRPFDAAFARATFPPDLIRAQFHDSFEYQGNWTPALLDRFRQSRGYDLRDHAAELFGQGDPEIVARVKHDYRQTLDEAHAAYVKVWVDWCHQHGWKARNQAHGSPGNLLDLYAGSDIPETETFGSTSFEIPGFRREARDIGKDSPQPIMARFAASAAHVTGKPLVSCETLTWLREHFRASLAMMKPEVDQMFLAGINHVLYHGTCYSPADAIWPGWQFYASVDFSPRNTIWRDLPAMNNYIARCQSVLQSGRPDNDVLLYWPVSDLWMQPVGMELRLTMHRTDLLLNSTFGKTAQDLIARGYGCDFISDRQLVRAHVEQNAIVTAGGAAFRLLVVPACTTMPLETAKKIAELSKDGARVVFLGIPQDVPGLHQHAERGAELRRVMKHFAAVDSIDAAIFSKAGVRREPMADEGLGFIRRTTDGGKGHFYFIANLTGKAVEKAVQLGVEAKSVAMLDPLTGAVGAASFSDGRISLQLQPGESIILRTFTGEAPQLRQLPPWPQNRRAGKPVPRSATWDVTFVDGGPNLPPPLKLEKLVSWTDAGGKEAKAFAGAARYRLEFDAPSSTDAADWLLDLGDVRESARVTLNGQFVGRLWSLPFRTTVGKHLKPGRNVLEVEVTNLAANRIRDLDRRGVEWKIMKEINFVNIHYKPFDASNWDLTPSGLLGPVTLTPLR
ncbi:MAG TPA: glycosyl hydrolase [Tepidisphaeraceae bacterium]|nr:glycosyl hydrolase [Tepidisphaeraceae bacterium]